MLCLDNSTVPRSPKVAVPELNHRGSIGVKSNQQTWPPCKNNIEWSKANTIWSILQLRETRGARNPNHQVVITHASHVCSQHSFGLPLRMCGMHRTQFDHARFDLLPLIIWSRVFWPSVKWNLRKAQRCSKSVFTFDRCCSHSVTFAYY